MAGEIASVFFSCLILPSSEQTLVIKSFFVVVQLYCAHDDALDRQLIETINSNCDSGYYNSGYVNFDIASNAFYLELLEFPFEHPAASLITSPPAMRPYDVRIHIGCLNRTFQHLSYLSTWTGKIIQCLNSVVGISHSMLVVLLHQNTSCRCCHCMFSVDGYAAHLSGMHCTNIQSSQSGTSAIRIYIIG